MPAVPFVQEHPRYACITLPRFRYHRRGFAFAVYPDQIVVTRRAYLKPETVIHPIRSIARVEMKGAPARLQLVLQDGRTVAYELTGQVAAAYEAILQFI
jgi:hypothetical protein